MDLCERSDSPYRHPWELSRTEILLKELKKIKVHGKVLDIGCGDGYFDKMMLKTFPEITEMWGIDIYAEKSSHNGVEHYINSYDEIYGNKFDYILLMDVLEHIEEDTSFMMNLHQYLLDGSILLITVPAFECLYSTHDEELHHFRRYNFKTLNKTLTGAGYKINDFSYFYLSLIFMRIITWNKTENLGMWKHGEEKYITKIIKTCLNIDYLVLRTLKKLGICIGGLSLLAICHENKHGLVSME